jgi:EF hand
MRLKKRYIVGILAVLIAVSIVAFNFFRKPKLTGPTPDEIVKELLEFDTNGDKQLSKDELSERMQNIITRGDTNHDGILNQEELRSLAVAQSNSMQSAASNDKREGDRQNQESEK